MLTPANPIFHYHPCLWLLGIPYPQNVLSSDPQTPQRSAAPLSVLENTIEHFRITAAAAASTKRTDRRACSPSLLAELERGPEQIAEWTGRRWP